MSDEIPTLYRIMTINDPLFDLCALLNEMKPGPVEASRKLNQVVAINWPYLFLIGDGMRDDKIHGKLENVTWNPPVLSFQIQHQDTIEHWEIDLNQRTRNLVRSGHRQVE